MNYMMDTPYSEDGVTESPFSLVKIIIITSSIIVALLLSTTILNSQLVMYSNSQFREGVRRGLKVYATQYDLNSNKALKRLSEGYLLHEDLDDSTGYNSILGGSQGIDSNALLVNEDKAKLMFERVLSNNQYNGYTVNTYDYYIINISCTYKLNGNNSTDYKTSFTAEILPKAEPTRRITLNPVDNVTTLCNELQARLDDLTGKGIQLDDLVVAGDNVSNNTGTIKTLKDSVNNRLRLSQYYSRTNPNGFGDQDSHSTVSTLNMYMFLGSDIPLKGLFKNPKNYTNFYEVQSYTTVRTGEEDVNK